MTELRVSETLAQAFPRLRIAVVVASGFDGREPWPEADAELAALEHAAADGHPLPRGRHQPETRAAERGRPAAAAGPDRPAAADQRRGGLLQPGLGPPWCPGGRVRPGRGGR